MKIRTALATAGLAAALTVGAGSAAFAADSIPKPVPTAEQVANRCAKAPTVLERLTTAKTKLGERLAKLNTAKAAAETAGKTKRSERIGAAITKVQTRLDKVAQHTTKLQAWTSEHCAS